MSLRTARAAWNIWIKAEERELGLIAAGIAFFGFLAVFPALAAVIALWGFWSDPSVIRAQVVLLQEVLPPEAYTLLSGQIEALLAANNRKLGWTTVFSTLLALWSARAGVAAMIRGLNAIHGLPLRQGMWHQVQAVAGTLVLVALALVAMALAVVVPLVLALVPIARGQAAVLELLNLGLGILIVVVGVGVLYRFGPNHGAREVRVLTRGLVVALVLWGVASRGLVIYLANFASYNQIYGSIGAVVAFLLWFYLSAYAILLGAAIDAERAHPHAPVPPTLQ